MERRINIRDRRKKYCKSEIPFSQSRTDLLLTEKHGFLEADNDDEKTYLITQEEIAKNVDITSATKYFELKLDYGPYRFKYFRDGRYVLLGGKRGHVAAFDNISKRLLCEFNVMESVHDVMWLHMPQLFAVAQKDWVYIYDKNGIEQHCLRKLHKVKFLEFLPYHFLLVSASENNFMTWTDTSYGETIATFRIKKARKITSLTQNPSNAVILSGHSNGVVIMSTPNMPDPVASILTHPAAVRDIKVNISGYQLATIGADQTFRIWDLRNYKCLQAYTLKSSPYCLAYSQMNMLAISMGNVVEIYHNFVKEAEKEPYMKYRCDSFIQNLEFSNFDDILGIGHSNGFSSILIPGSGEPNFDALEVNPFMSRAQRKEAEVKQLLDKIPAHLITLDPLELAKVKEKFIRESAEEKVKKLHIDMPKISFVAPSKKRKKIKKKLQNKQEKNEILQKLKEKRKTERKAKNKRHKKTRVAGIFD